MAENNIQVNIDAQSTVDDMIARVAEAFAAASGLTDDGNHEFSLGNGLVIKIEVYSTTSCSIYAYLPNGNSRLIQNVGYSSAVTFIYNKSSGGKAFAFGLYAASIANKSLVAAIAQDTGGNTRILFMSSNSLYLLDKNQTSIVSLMVPSMTNSAFTFATISKLGAYFARETYDDLYQLNAAPSFSVSGTDMSIYSGGNLYKLITSGYGVICMKV